MLSGNVGHAPFFLPPVLWLMGEGSLNLHAAVQQVAAAHQQWFEDLVQQGGLAP